MDPNSTAKSPGKARFQNGHGLRFVLAWFLLIALVISTTVLLANDHKNLNSLLKLFGAESWFAKPVAKPVVVKSTSEAGAKETIPQWLLVDFGDRTSGQFDGTSSFESEDFCRIINDALGKQVLSWAPSPLAPKEKECWTELPDAPSDDNSPANSLFIQVRGTSEDKVSDIRLKLVVVQNSQTPDYRPIFDTISTAILNALNWSALTERSADMKELRPFREQHNGIEISLSKEMMMEGAYNLIIHPVADSSKRNGKRAYFDRSSWLPMFEGAPSQNAYFTFPSAQPGPPKSKDTGHLRPLNPWDRKTGRRP